MNSEQLGQEVFDELKRQNKTIYNIAKEVSLKRNQGTSPASRYHSAITKSLANPANSKLSTILDIVESLGGTLTINWDNHYHNTDNVVYRYITVNYKVINYKPRSHCYLF